MFLEGLWGCWQQYVTLGPYPVGQRLLAVARRGLKWLQTVQTLLV